MKKYLSLVFILSVTALTGSCSEKSDNRRPDAVYENTQKNPQLGAPSSLSEVGTPISQSLGTSKISLPKSSGKKSHKDTVQESLVIPAQIQEPGLPVPTSEPAMDEVHADTVENTEGAQPAPQEPAIPEAVAPKVEEKNLGILSMRPVPEDGSVQVISISENEAVAQSTNMNEEEPSRHDAEPAPQQEQEQADTYTWQNTEMEENPPAEVKDMSEENPVVAKETDKVLPMPASLLYKSQKQNGPDDDVSKDNNPKPNVIEKVADFFTPDKIRKKKSKQVEERPAETATELPSPESVTVGECMAKVTTKGEYQEVEEDVLVKEATTKTIEVPAEYRDVEEVVVVTPEKQEEVITPAKYKDVEENVLVTPGQKSWKKVDGKSDLMQLVEQDPVFRKVIKKVLTEEEKHDIKTTPAVTRTVTKKVLVSEATTKTIEVPAEYKKVKKMVEVTPDKIEWLAALCENKLDKDTTIRIQGKLKEEGFDVKVVDGILGPVTRNALFDYQRSLGMESPAITIKTIESLIQNN